MDHHVEGFICLSLSLLSQKVSCDKYQFVARTENDALFNVSPKWRNSPRRVTRANTLHTDVFDATATKNGNNTTDNKDSRSPPGSRSGGNGGRGRSLRHLRFHESFRMTETVTVTQIQSFREVNSIGQKI